MDAADSKNKTSKIQILTNQTKAIYRLDPTYEICLEKKKMSKPSKSVLYQKNLKGRKYFLLQGICPCYTLSMHSVGN